MLSFFFLIRYYYFGEIKDDNVMIVLSDKYLKSIFGLKKLLFGFFIPIIYEPDKNIYNFAFSLYIF